MKRRIRKVFDIYKRIVIVYAVVFMVTKAINLKPYVPILISVLNEAMLNLEPIANIKRFADKSVFWGM